VVSGPTLTFLAYAESTGPAPPAAARFKGALQQVDAAVGQLLQDARAANATGAAAASACSSGCIPLSLLLPGGSANASAAATPRPGPASGADATRIGGEGGTSISASGGGAGGAGGAKKSHLYSLDVDGGSWIGGGGAGGRTRIGSGGSGSDEMRGSGGGSSSSEGGAPPACVCLSAARAALAAAAAQLRGALLPATAGMALVTFAGLWTLACASGARALAKRRLLEAQREAAPAPLLDFFFGPKVSGVRRRSAAGGARGAPRCFSSSWALAGQARLASGAARGRPTS
jgi:hypothetical protein